MFKSLIALALLFTLTTFVDGQEIMTGKSAESAKLRVALFPYIPVYGNFAKLQSRVESEFQKTNPDQNVGLELRPLNPNDDFYDIAFLRTLLDSDPSKGGYDVVEIDSVLLGDLVEAGLVSPWADSPLAVKERHFFPAAKEAMSYQGQIYGVPHWMCGYFLFTSSRKVSRTNNTQKLVSELQKLGTPVRNFSGNFVSSWDAPALYLGAWEDAHPDGDLSAALTQPLDDRVLRDFRLLSNECQANGTNPCIDKAYKDNDRAALEFAKGESDSTFGYSERLNVILRESPQKRVFVTPLQLSEVGRPLVFVDVLVLNKRCGERCQKAAVTFANYLNDPKTQEWIIMAEDADFPSPPRYLLPASEDAYLQHSIGGDKYYKQFRQFSAHATPLPQKGLLSAGRCMRSKLLESLGVPPKPEDCPAASPNH